MKQQFTILSRDITNQSNNQVKIATLLCNFICHAARGELCCVQWSACNGQVCPFPTSHSDGWDTGQLQQLSVLPFLSGYSPESSVVTRVSLWGLDLAKFLVCQFEWTSKVYSFWLLTNDTQWNDGDWEIPAVAAICGCGLIKLLFWHCQRPSLCWVCLPTSPLLFCYFGNFFFEVCSWYFSLVFVVNPVILTLVSVQILECGQVELMTIWICKAIFSMVSHTISFFCCHRGKDSYTRRSCQTVLAAHLLTLVRSIAPVLPHLAEDAWSHLPFVFYQDGGLQAETVFEAGWPSVDDKWHSFSEHLAFWTTLLQVSRPWAALLRSRLWCSHSWMIWASWLKSRFWGNCLHLVVVIMAGKRRGESSHWASPGW